MCFFLAVYHIHLNKCSLELHLGFFLEDNAHLTAFPRNFAARHAKIGATRLPHGTKQD
jgi:hypothetical protein